MVITVIHVVTWNFDITDAKITNRWLTDWLLLILSINICMLTAPGRIIKHVPVARGGMQYIYP